MSKQHPQDPVLSVTGLTVDYHTATGPVRTLKNVNVDVHRGRIVGVAGESGSGKSTAALSALGWDTAVQKRVSGSSVLDGTDLFTLSPAELRRIWGKRVGYVPQEIGGSLHPTYRVGTQFRESLRVNSGLKRRAADERAIELLTAAQVPDAQGALKRYPHQFSGGQLQRIAIALALAPLPDVLILDEPTTGLDVTTQKTVARVLRELVDARQVGALLITHDLALLAELADDVVIMYAGEVMESGPISDVVDDPKHPYTRALLDAVPSALEARTPHGIAGQSPGRVVDGQCSFAERCSHRLDVCNAADPELTSVSPVRLVRCVRVGELALRSAVSPARIRQVVDLDVALEVNDITLEYPTKPKPLVAVESVNLQVQTGGITALVGESGSGKSTLGRVIAGIETPKKGFVSLDGEQLPQNPRDRSRKHRRDIQLIFQNPSGSLNPRRKIGDHLAHVASKFTNGTRSSVSSDVVDALQGVQLQPELADRYPSQLSGGQRQRVAIAAAFIARPQLVICDEITSGQDVSVQAAILETLADLQRSQGTSVLFISHDLGVVRSIADAVYVMQRGRIVEQGRTEEVFEAPQHAYTKELLAAVPLLSPAADHADWLG